MTNLIVNHIQENVFQTGKILHHWKTLHVPIKLNKTKSPCDPLKSAKRTQGLIWASWSFKVDKWKKQACHKIDIHVTGYCTEYWKEGWIIHLEEKHNGHKKYYKPLQPHSEGEHTKASKELIQNTNQISKRKASVAYNTCSIIHKTSQRHRCNLLYITTRTNTHASTVPLRNCHAKRTPTQANLSIILLRPYTHSGRCCAELWHKPA